MQVVLLIIVLLLALPFLLLLGFFNLVAAGLENLGIAPGLVLLLLAGMLLGSLVNVPLGRHRVVEVQEPVFFGLFSKTRYAARGLSVNVGGALVPLLISLYLLAQIPWQAAVLPTLVMVAAANRLSRYVPGRGVALPVLVPPVLAALLAFLFAPEAAAPVAFVSGTLGVLVGADLLRLPFISQERGVLSIGGGGVFDGIFLVGIISALLAGL